MVGRFPDQSAQDPQAILLNSPIFLRRAAPDSPEVSGITTMTSARLKAGHMGSGSITWTAFAGACWRFSARQPTTSRGKHARKRETLVCRNEIPLVRLN